MWNTSTMPYLNNACHCICVLENIVPYISKVKTEKYKHLFPMTIESYLHLDLE